MSGGYFDYIQFKINDAADEINKLIHSNNIKDEWEYSNNYNENTLLKFKRAELILRIVAEMVQRIDWLVSGDDNEESFHLRWSEKISKILNESVNSCDHIWDKKYIKTGKNWKELKCEKCGIYKVECEDESYYSFSCKES